MWSICICASPFFFFFFFFPAICASWPIFSDNNPFSFPPQWSEAALAPTSCYLL